MPRAKRIRLTLDFSSFEKNLNQTDVVLEDVKTRAIKHYNFVLRLIEELGTDWENRENLQMMSNLEMSRNNAIKSLQDYMKLKKELLVVHKDAIKMFEDVEYKKNKVSGKNGAQGDSGSLSRDDQAEIEKYIATLTNIKTSAND